MNGFVGPLPPPMPWQRLDYSPKGPGFASIYLPGGELVTELSLGDPRYGYPLYPSVYQGITPWDMQTVANVAQYGYDPLQAEVFRRAGEVASERMASGLSPFWTPADGEPGSFYELLRR